MIKHFLRLRESLGVKILAVAILFLIANGAFVYLHFPSRYEADGRAALRREIESLAKVVSTSLGPSLDFGDSEEVSLRLEAIGEVPEVLNAKVVGARNQTLARYFQRTKSGEPAPDPFLAHESVERVAYAILSSGGEPLGNLVVTYSLDRVFAESARYRRTILVVTLLLVIANGLAMGLVARRITQPLLHLTEAARKISAGDLALRLRPGSRDEVGQLTESFNVMASYLFESRNVIERHTEGLEALVRERTAELSRKNEELLLQTQRAEEANRLKSEFLANMSHELRTPLSSIIGFLSLILEGICTDEKERLELLTDAHRSSMHLLSLINYVLDLTKIEAGRLEVMKEPVDVDTECREVEKLLVVQAKARGITLRFATNTGMPEALADAERVRQVLINLVGNAIKFTSRGSVVVEGRYDRAQSAVVVEVIDTGIGIPREKQSTLFQKFTQVDGSQTRRYGGTGLGLALSKSLVELMGGRIGLSSAGEGQGTRVWFTLPVAAAPVESRDPLTVEAQAILVDGDPTAPLVLILEDDPPFARFLSRVLRSGGFRSIIARTGDEAFRLAEQHRPLAITADLGLPAAPGAEFVTGADFVRGVRRVEWDCRVIVVTGQPESATKSLPPTGPGGRPLAILQKPVKPEDVLRQLEGIAAERGSRPRTILVADDDPAMSRIVEGLARQEKARVISARDGAEALRLLEGAATRVDLLLLDLDMPELDGFGVLRGLARMPESLQPDILIVTNYPELARGEGGEFLTSSHVWGIIPKARLGEDPDLLRRALARIARHEDARHAATNPVG